MFNSAVALADSSDTLASQRQLLQLNADFLRLLSVVDRPSHTSHTARQQLRLSHPHGHTLAQCSETALQRMAHCGFSLFSLSLHRVDLWCGIAARSAVLPDDQRYLAITAPHSPHHLYGHFMECSLFFAWHLAQRSPHDARLLLGMPEDCAALIATLQLWQCRHIARTHSKLLSLRWPRHPFFWADLLRYGQSGKQQHFKFVVALGSQLMALDLEPSAIGRLRKTAPEG